MELTIDDLGNPFQRLIACMVAQSNPRVTDAEIWNPMTRCIEIHVVPFLPEKYQEIINDLLEISAWCGYPKNTLAYTDFLSNCELVLKNANPYLPDILSVPPTQREWLGRAAKLILASTQIMEERYDIILGPDQASRNLRLTFLQCNG